MRSFAKRIADLVKDEVSKDEMKKVKEEMLSEVHSTGLLKYKSKFSINFS